MKKKPTFFAYLSIVIGLSILIGVFFSVKVILVMVAIALVAIGIGVLIENGYF